MEDKLLKFLQKLILLLGGFFIALLIVLSIINLIKTF